MFWLKGYVTDISADIWEVAAHYGVFAVMHYTNSRLLYLPTYFILVSFVVGHF